MDVAAELCLLIKAAAREVERQANDVLRPLGLTNAQAEALEVIGRFGPLSLGDLGRLLIAEGGQPSRLVDRLVTAGLVDRHDSPDDRRRLVLDLTGAGRRAMEETLAAKSVLRDRVLAAVDGADITPIRDLIGAYLAATPLGDTVDHRRDLEDRASTTGVTP